MAEIKNLADVPEQQVFQFLGNLGFGEKIIGWKYLDQEFNGGRARVLLAVEG